MNLLQSSCIFKGEIECNLCGRDRLRVIENDQRPYNVLKCKNCSLVFVYPHPDPTMLNSHYDNGYYKEWIAAQKRQRLRMWKKRLAKIRKDRQAGRLLDIGCGEGTFLALAQKEGWQIYGTEISAFASKYATASLGTNIFCGDLLSTGFEENFFDVVTMWHVLEHVSNPKRYLSEIHRILKPKGLLVLAVPNVNNIIFRIAYRIIKRRKVKLFTIGEKEVHLYHFSPNTLKDFLDRTGFDCISLSPDFGIIETPKKLINLIAVLFFYLFRMQVFDATEIFAVPKRESNR